MQKIGEILKKNIRWIILLIGLIIFFEILEDVYENEIYQFDNQIDKAVSYFISDGFTNVIKVITNIGSAPVILTVTAIILIVAKNKKISIAVCSNLVTITALNQLLKRIIARPRPIEHRLIDETGYSFPSGHSMVSMAFYGFLIYLSYQKIKNPYIKTIVCILLSIIILLIGLSRIYLGVHYPSDVIAGFCISLSYLALFTSIAKKYIE